MLRPAYIRQSNLSESGSDSVYALQDRGDLIGIIHRLLLLGYNLFSLVDETFAGAGDSTALLPGLHARLSGCIMININEEWITGKSYLSMDEE